jgi:hypothetical protein
LVAAATRIALSVVEGPMAMRRRAPVVRGWGFADPSALATGARFGGMAARLRVVSSE